MKKKLSTLLTLLTLVFSLAFSGCVTGGNTVALSYPSELGAYPWCRWSVTVVGFTDQRADKQTLGAKDLDEGEYYVAGSDVSDWVTRAFVDEFKNRGCGCEYRAGAADADTQFVISGEVLAVSLDKIGFTDFNSKVRMFVELTRNGERVYAETYNGELDRSFALGSDAPGDVLAEALQFVVTDAVEKLINHMKDADR